MNITVRMVTYIYNTSILKIKNIKVCEAEMWKRNVRSTVTNDCSMVKYRWRVTIGNQESKVLNSRYM